MDNRLYWLWLQKCVGYGREYSSILSCFEDIKSLYDASEEERRLSGAFDEQTPKKAKSILASMNKYKLEDFEEILRICDKNEIYVLTEVDEYYPNEFKKIKNPPCVIYARGDVKIILNAPLMSKKCSHMASKPQSFFSRIMFAH